MNLRAARYNKTLGPPKRGPGRDAWGCVLASASVTLRNITSRNSASMKASKPEFGELERAVMNAVWGHGPLSSEDIRAKLERPLKEATVRTVLRRLEAKGYVTHKVDNRTFIYTAAEPRRRVAANAVKRIVDWFCDGSIDEVLVGLVDAKMLDRKQIDRLREAVERAEQQPKPRSQRAKKGTPS